MAYKIYVLGPQGSGKGTQAKQLSIRLGIPTFSMGQLLRNEVAKQTEIGLKVKKTLEAGELVPEEYANIMLERRIKESDAEDGYVLDGFPRDLLQLKMLTADYPTHVVVLEVFEAESIERLSHRLTCDTCGNVCNMRDGHVEGDACDACGKGKLIRRSDDTPRAIKKRLGIYEKETKPVIAEFEKKGIVLHVDGVGKIMDVHERIMEALELSHSGCDHALLKE